MIVIRLDPASEPALRLLARSDAYMASLYPAESNHLDDVATLQSPNVLFLGVRADDQIVACGAVKIVEAEPPYGEIKRVFVLDEFRGRGISTLLMTYLEQHLLRAGVSTVRLETGVSQPEAIGLYRRLGYTVRPPFGDYVLDPLSLFMEKELDAEAVFGD